MQLPLTGACQCRNVRYEVRREPLTVYVCHCTECQRQSASAFSLSMIVPHEAVAVVAGEPKEWLRRTDSGRMVSCVLCRDCGVRLYHNPQANQAITIVKPGTLDDTTWLRPVGHIWIRSAQRWFDIPADTVNYDVQPPDFSRLIEAWSAQRHAPHASAAKAGGGSVIAVDPFVSGRLFGGAATRTVFEKNLADAGLSDVVRLEAVRSTELRPTWTTPLAMLYIDGKHDYWTVRDDLRWVEHLAPGAPVLIHDSFSSIGVTLGLLGHVLPGRQLRYLGRVGSLARFEVGPPSARDRLRLVAELPWFVRNVAIKIALRVGRLFGHRSTPDPY